MASLEALQPQSRVKGLAPSGPVVILNVQRHGPDVVEVTYRDVSGKDHSELLFRDREQGVPMPFEDGAG